MSNVDESKVKALESIFGGQDITASVIRTVLTSNDNKFDDAVDSLLNMTTGPATNSRSPPRPSPSPNWAEDPIDNEERAKIRTLENMFGTDLSNSVICTVLESNRGELVDAVDTLLNMTSKEINPQFQEKSRVEADINSYEEFKRLQIKLQEEEARAAKEQQQKLENEMLKKNNKQDINETDKYKQIMEEQEKVLRDYEAKVKNEQTQKMDEIRKKKELERLEEKMRRETQEFERLRIEKQQQEARAKIEREEADRIKRAEIELAKREEAERVKREEIERAKKEREQLEVRKREEIERAKLVEAKIAEAMAAALKREMEEKLRFEAEKQQLLLDQLRKEEQKLREAEALRNQELEKLKAKALAEEKRRKEEEDRRLAEVVDEIRRTEQKRVDKLIRHQREEVERKTMVEMESQRKRIEDEQRERRRRLEEEEAMEKHRRMLEEERIALQKARAELQAKLKAQEEAEIQKAEELTRLKIIAETERIRQAQKEEQEREERARIEEEEGRRRLQEEERIRIEREEQQERERLRVEEENRLRVEQEAIEQRLREEEEARARDAEALNKKEEKLSYDLLAASAIFIPPKELAEDNQVSITANVVGDTVVCTWDMPAGNAASTNWLGIYSISQPANNKYTQFAYTNSTSAGQHVFKSVTPGHYEARFFANKGYEAPLARSVTIRVGPTATIMAQLQGEHLLVYYTLDPISSTPTREWLGIYEKTQRRNKLYLSTAYGNAEGQIMMKAPRTPGEYQVRLFATGSVYNYQAKADFVVEDNDCINIEPTSLLAGANVNISWILRTVEPSTSDWVGLYRADEQNNSNYLSCTYTQGASVGVATVQVPKEPGVYEFRLFAKAKGKYTTFRKSSALTIV